VDYAWWAADARQKELSDRLQAFFEGQGIGRYGNNFTVDGTPTSNDHSSGLVAMNAVASLSATESRAWLFVDELWQLEVPSGKWRYYDGMLYLMALLHLSGNFRAHLPA
jgi:oligosaccharide reducing-end xylanase